MHPHLVPPPLRRGGRHTGACRVPVLAVPVVASPLPEIDCSDGALAAPRACVPVCLRVSVCVMQVFTQVDKIADLFLLKETRDIA
jgi:hypothetical protein